MAALFDDTADEKFGDDLEALLRCVRDADASLVATEPDGPVFLQIDGRGLTASGLRYSDRAFREICHLLSRGLFRFVLDMSAAPITFPVGVSAFNACLNAVFYSEVADKYFAVVDEAKRQIVGFVSADAEYVPPSILLNGVVSCLDAALPFEYKIVDARIRGPQFQLRAVSSDPLFDVHVRDADYCYSIGASVNYNLGFGLRVGAMVTRPSQLGYCGRFFRFAATRRTGATFRAKLSQAIKRVAALLADSQSARRAVLRAASVEIPAESFAAAESRRQQITGRLRVAGLSLEVARAAASLMYRNDYDADDLGTGVSVNIEFLRSRCLLDLVHCLMRVGARYDWRAQEIVERVGNKVLFQWSKELWDG